MHPPLRRVLTTRLIRYPLYLLLLLTLIEVIGIFIPEDWLEFEFDTGETAQHHHLHAATNPYRDLPEDQLTAVKEVLFTAETLRDTFLPTSVPDDDDYEFLSKLVRSLETREDISWTTLYETGVGDTLSAIADRHPWHAPFADEPLGLTDRFWKLNDHWSRLGKEAGKPERWEVEHDSTFLPPLTEARGVDGEAEAEAGLEAFLSEEQREKMEKRWAEWKKERDRRVSYLKIHPPTPLAWFPLPTGEGRREAWEEVMDDGVVEAGKSVDPGRLAASQKWKPWYTSLMLEDVPFEWRAPGEDPEEEMTPEEFDRWMEKFNRQREGWNERKRKQEEVQEKLKAERDVVKGVKDEL
ncbi:hypothetical protein CONLIGDRAFT_634155 [Coniochaeta ligniaria NRRL 30616]|uniref:Uncharacterized protein n=1 Tax=Coniochaeta ligniaria NRRL 30616 TaxID=1408157 RepID=A0A1J7IJQ1_9PEZI|nr:hypothetical protein CONLIGDRAFT_634155 [Coniochaeta ligniaria NRRL 30616]